MSEEQLVQLVSVITNLSVMVLGTALQLEQLAVDLPSGVTKYRGYFDVFKDQ
jgi:hypothetical protein